MQVTIKTIWLIILLISQSCLVYPQRQRLDSVKKSLLKQKEDTTRIAMLYDLAENYAQFAPDSSLVYGQEALALSKKLHSDTGIFWSIVAINKALYALGNYSLELDYAYQAWPIGQKLNNTYSLGFSDGMLGDCFFNLGQFNEALNHYRSILVCAQNDSIPDLPQLYVSLVPIFQGLKQYDSALFYARKGYALYKRSPGNEGADHDNLRVKTYQFRFLGEAFAGKEQYDSALYYYRASLSVSQNIDLRLNELDVYDGLAKIYQTLQQPDSAIFFASMVIADKTSGSYPVSKLKAAGLLADIYELKNKPDSTVKYLRMSAVIHDSLYNKDKMLLYHNIIFKDQQKQQEIKLAEARVQRQYLGYFFIALLAVGIVIAAIVIRNKRVRQLQAIRNSIADDLHDDIGSALSSISIMNELAKQKSPEAMTLLSAIGENTAAIQENMSDIIWAIKAGDDSFENVVRRMNRFAAEILEAKNIGLSFKCGQPPADLRLNIDQRKNFYLFFKEAVNNAAKYSSAQKVSVSVSTHNHAVELNICDDGKGFDTAAQYNGNGMGSLKKRAIELGGDCAITSVQNQGTEVRLLFTIISAHRWK